MSAPRVAMIGQKGWPPVHGGIERHVAELAPRLAARGWQVDIYSRPHYSAHDGPTDLPGVRVLRRASVATKHLDAITHAFACTLDAARGGADVVHYHALGPGLLAGLPRWLAGKPTVVTVHGLDWQREKWGPFARLVLRAGEQASFRLADRTVVVSRALQDWFRERHDRQTVYIPNGIAAPVYRQPRLVRDRGIDRPYALFVGRLVPEKGCHLLLSAWQRLPAAVRAAHQLVIAGDAGFTDSYVRALRAQAPADANFLGFVHGELLEELYTNAALVVLPSTLEGLSIALLEGMSYARCCLASDIPPNREAAGGCVPLFRAGDAGDLAERLAQLLADPAERRRCGDAAQLHVIENYSWERAADLTVGVYRELLAGRGAAAAAGGGEAR